MAYSKQKQALVSGGMPFALLGIHHEGFTTHSHLGIAEATEDDGLEEQMHLASYIKANQLLTIDEWPNVKTGN